jgi:hypothetical protein
LLRVFDRLFDAPQSDFAWMEDARPQFNIFFPLGPGIVNDTMLKELIVSGWRPETDSR